MINRRQFVGAAIWAIGMQGAAFGQGAAPGIRSMLVTAARAATRRLGREDGFFGDEFVRIPLPGLLGRTQGRLAPLGLSGPLDDLELRMNRAAEAVMPRARDLFIDAIRSMQVTDGIDIIQGSDTAATEYLRGRTQSPITRLLGPPMEDTLAASGAYGVLDDAAQLADRRSGIGRFFGSGRSAQSGAETYRGEITDFAVARAVDGVFHYIGEEERQIRRNPAGRTRDILQGLFGQ
ncbi:DUF4197 domain-containing protein [Hyphobacterium sp.]|uniref:DUF4197 domain-containing protein n=1 Tax=Hyphobacterium sp. TaxID=2004662 RepID=UPI003B51F57F